MIVWEEQALKGLLRESGRIAVRLDEVPLSPSLFMSLSLSFLFLCVCVSLSLSLSLSLFLARSLSLSLSLSGRFLPPDSLSTEPLSER